MNIIQRYRRLSLWSKIGFWGAIASIVALLPLVAPQIMTLLPVQRTLVQEGTIKTAGDRYYDVYYVTPYVGNPELEWPQTINSPDRNSFEIIEQRPDGFRIERFGMSNLWTNGIRWRATGIRAK